MATFISDISREIYDQFVNQHSLSHVLQSYQWSEVKNNWKSLHVGLEDDHKELCATALILIKPLPLGYSLWYIAKGPVFDVNKPEVLKEFMTHIISLAKTKKVIAIKVDPGVVYKCYRPQEEVNPTSESLNIKQVFEEMSFKHLGYTDFIGPTINPRGVATTFKPEDYSRENFITFLPKRTQKALKEVEQAPIEIKMYGPEGLDDFVQVINKTQETKGINLRNKEYFKRIMDAYQKDAILYIAHLNIKKWLDDSKEKLEKVNQEINALADNQKKKLFRLQQQKTSAEKNIEEAQFVFNKYGDIGVVAGVLSVLYGKSFEMLYAGFDRDFYRYPAQDKCYVESMMYAFDKGATFASMGGIHDFEDGLWIYKDRFNPKAVEYLGEFDFAVKPFIYKLFNTLVPLAKKILRKVRR